MYLNVSVAKMVKLTFVGLIINIINVNGSGVKPVIRISLRTEYGTVRVK